ncbi:hypothetical protein ACET3Z_033076 [Daucus carota]
MGKISMTTLALFAIILSISAVESIIDQRPEAVEKWFNKLGQKKEKMTKLHFFLHEAAAPGSANQTAFLVAESNISSTSPTLYGQVSVIDDILREGPEPDSPIVGRAQGLSVSSDLREPTIIMSLNFVFTTGKYNGSTLSINARNPLLKQVQDAQAGSFVLCIKKGFVELWRSMPESSEHLEWQPKEILSPGLTMLQV